MHASTGDDRGGNTVSVTWFSKQTDLHSVWDTGLIEQKSFSYSEYAAWLTRSITPQNIVACSAHDPAVWIHESIACAKRLIRPSPRYPGTMPTSTEAKLMTGSSKL